MGMKALYSRMIRGLERLPGRLEILKTTLAEDRAILLKRKIYETIQWSKEQQQQFDDYWKKVYGKKKQNHIRKKILMLNLNSF